MDLISQCALRVGKILWRPGHGGFAFTVVCKATFELLPDSSPLAFVQEPVCENDVITGESESLALASDLVPFKKRPEVLVIGNAYAPEGQAVPSLVARLIVGEIDKAILVVGNRYFDRFGQLSEPAPFTRMPLVWERAACGPNNSNPSGRPIDNTARTDASGRVPAPNLFPPGLMLRSRRDIVPPVGFGPIAPMWPSRAACLHRHTAWWNPSRWHEQPLPADIDFEYFNAAPPDQQRTLAFSEETLYLEHLHPRCPRLSTRLMPVSPIATVDHGSGPQPMHLRCDTLIIDTDRALAMLVWRAHVLLDRPDQPGLVAVTGPTDPKKVPPAWSRVESDSGATLVPDAFMPSSAVLPFSDAAASVPGSTSHSTPARAIGPGPAAITPNHREELPLVGAPSMGAMLGTETIDVGLLLKGAVLPFGSTQGESAPRPESPPWEKSLGVLSTAYSADDEDSEKTLIPATASPAAAPLPFGSSQAQSIVRPPALSPEISSGLPFVPSPTTDDDGPATARRSDVPTGPQALGSPLQTNWAPTREDVPPPHAPASPWARSSALPSPVAETPASEAPVPPPFLGAITTFSKGSVEAGDGPLVPATEASPSREVPAAEPAPDIAFDEYPPDRCGAFAARLACDEGSTSDLLRAEDLDAARWKRVHEHWLDRIRDEASRGRKKLLTEYDGAYLSALEAKRGPIALEEYAKLAEAAERGAISGALTERGLPEGAWPHIHRVWIGRMVKDVRLGKQVRAAIDALRAA